MTYLDVEGITYLANDEPIQDIHLAVKQGEMVALLGATGAGKTTLLRCIAGLNRSEAGRIWLDGVEVTQSAPERRDVAVVFPSYSLYFHMSVRENIAFPLRMRKESKSLIEGRVQEAAQMLGISHLLNRRLTQISGGERQRVSIGRAIVRRPKLFLFDEPFIALDLKLREQLRADLKMIQEELETAAIFATSDPIEALTVGDRVASIDGGSIVQVGDPRDLYENPASMVVGDQMTIPRMNALKVPMSLALRVKDIDLDSVIAAGSGGSREEVEAIVAFRPEETRLVAPGSGVQGVVRLVENIGNYRLVYCELAHGGMVVCHHRGAAPSVDSTVALDAPASRMMVFDAQDGSRIPG